MAQKNFATAPQPAKQPTDNQIAAFERGGVGHDKPTAKVEPIRRLSLDLPQSLHIRFKTACSATSRKMGNELRALIEMRITELEQEAGIIHK